MCLWGRILEGRVIPRSESIVVVDLTKFLFLAVPLSTAQSQCVWVLVVCSSCAGLFVSINIWEIVLHLTFGKFNGFPNQWGFQLAWASPFLLLFKKCGSVWCYKHILGPMGMSRNVPLRMAQRSCGITWAAMRSCSAVRDNSYIVLSPVGWWF